MTPLQTLLTRFRAAAVSEREKGTCFEELFVQYLRHEPTCRDLYSHVRTYADWAHYNPDTSKSKAAPVLKQKKQLRDHQKTALACSQC